MMRLYRKTYPKSTHMGLNLWGCQGLMSPSLLESHWEESFGGGGRSLGRRRVEKGESGVDMWIDIPGVTDSGLDVHVTKEGYLDVKARRQWEREAGKEGEEGEYEDYHRIFSLPEGVDEEGVSAESRDGVLRVHFPFLEKELDKSRRIEVRGLSKSEVGAGEK